MGEMSNRWSILHILILYLSTISLAIEAPVKPLQNQEKPRSYNSSDTSNYGILNLNNGGLGLTPQMGYSTLLLFSFHSKLKLLVSFKSFAAGY